MSIPKIIHYCWFGKKPISKKEKQCLDSWKHFCPDYEIVEWNESNFNINCCAYVSEAYKAGRYAFVSDYVRLCVLEEYGGIYFDVDVELLAPLNNLLEYNGFAGFSKGWPTASGARRYEISSGNGIGAVPKSPIIECMRAEYDNLHFIKSDGSEDLTPCEKRNTAALKKLGLAANNRIQRIDGFIFLPTAYFCPYDYITKRVKITSRTYAIHYFDGAWTLPKSFIGRVILNFKCTRLGIILTRICGKTTCKSER